MTIGAEKQPTSDAKRDGIIRAAQALFLRDGFSKAVMADVARNADVSTATLYKYFESKEVLFEAVVLHAAASVQDDFGVVAPGTSARDFFMQALASAHEVQQQAQVTALLRVAIAEVAASPSLPRKVFDTVIGGRYARLQAALDEMVGRGLLKPHDTAFGARIGMGMIKELFIWPALFVPDFKLPPDAVARADEAINIYLAAYGA
ncbi:TetR/AcrR family transcriptional regulator [Parvibaculum sp.]|uniref:TetR/AcrR family transcriptional regulator n=1 Tax=Parvibaculum sp. TaxID=2024848 RepID=UPI00320FFFF0